MENLIDEALKRRTAHMLQELGMKSKKTCVKMELSAHDLYCSPFGV